MSPRHAGSRVALVSQHHDPAWQTPAAFIAGDETRDGLSRALVRRGWAVDVVVEAPFDTDAMYHGVSWRFRKPDRVALGVRALGRSAGDPYPQIRSPAPHLVRAVQEHPPDVIHAFDLVFYPLLWSLGRVGPPVVAHFHGGRAARRPAWRLAETAALRRTARLLFTTRDHARPWVENGYPEGQVRLLFETSVDVSCVDSLSSPLWVRQRVGVAEGRRGVAGTRELFVPAPQIASVGRLDAVKDPFTTLAGFERLLATHPGAVLHMTWTDAPLHTAVLARARGLGDHVRLHGRLSRAGARALISGADAFVQSSTREVCGIAVLEALALGTPPVVTNIPSFAALLGDCGARFQPGDPEGLAVGLSAVLSDPSQRDRCRARFDSALSFDALALDVERVYRELV